MPKKQANEPLRQGEHRLALTPEAREAQLCAAAEQLVYQQILDGTASSQVLTHYLKLASTREKKEQALLDKKIELSQAKTKEIESNAHMEQMMAEALDALKLYRGAVFDEDAGEEDVY